MLCLIEFSNGKNLRLIGLTFGYFSDCSSFSDARTPFDSFGAELSG